MSKVTLEGTLTPAVGGPRRGERREVEADEKARNLVKAGAARVVSGRLDAVVDEDDDVDGSDQGGEQVAGEQSSGDGPPAGNASTEEWAAFVESKGAQVPRDDEGNPTVSRAQLIDAWKAIEQQAHGGS